MPKLSSRQDYLSKVMKKRKAAIKGNEVNFLRKNSTKFRKILAENNSIIKKLQLA